MRLTAETLAILGGVLTMLMFLRTRMTWGGRPWLPESFLLVALKYIRASYIPSVVFWKSKAAHGHNREERVGVADSQARGQDLLRSQKKAASRSCFAKRKEAS